MLSRVAGGPGVRGKVVEFFRGEGGRPREAALVGGWTERLLFLSCDVRGQAGFWGTRAV